MDFDAVADEVYAATREEFVTLRDARSQEAKSAGDRDLADRIRKLPKPTLAAWAVNQFVRRHPKEADAVVALGGALRTAHENLTGDELRALSRQRHDLVGALTERACNEGRYIGITIGGATAAQIHDTFDAAVTNPDAARTVRGGRLHTALSAETEQWPATTAAPSQPSRRSVTARKRAKFDRQTGESERERRDAERREAARQELATAQAEQQDAEDELADAERDVDRAATAAAELRERLDEAKKSEQQSIKVRNAARKRLRTATNRTEAARRELDTLEGETKR
jgi:hypothetical protein